MKLTKETLKRIIKEEMSSLLNELGDPSFGNPDDPRDDMFRSITGHGPEDLPFNNALNTLRKELEKINGYFATFKFEETDEGLEVEYKSTDPHSEFYGTALVIPSGTTKVIIDGNEMSIEQAVLDLSGDFKV